MRTFYGVEYQYVEPSTWEDPHDILLGISVHYTVENRDQLHDVLYSAATYLETYFNPEIIVITPINDLFDLPYESDQNGKYTFTLKPSNLLSLLDKNVVDSLLKTERN